MANHRRGHEFIFNETGLRVSGTDVETTFPKLRQTLPHWGETASDERSVLGLSSKRLIYGYMMYNCSVTRREPLKLNDDYTGLACKSNSSRRSRNSSHLR